MRLMAFNEHISGMIIIIFYFFISCEFNVRLLNNNHPVISLVASTLCSFMIISHLLFSVVLKYNNG